LEQERDRFGQALRSVREQLRSGRYVLGEQLMVTALARSLRLSATPVREALSRLAGEGLIEDRRGTGFFAWRLDAVDLVELYDLQATYLTTALERGAGVQLTSLGCGREAADLTVFHHGAEPPVVRLEAVFAMLVTEARSAALARAHGLLADRLAPSRHAERAVLSDTADELVALERAVFMLDQPAILQVLTDYHRRRTSRAPQIVAAMRASAVGEGF
jgi:DNA-binding transcriptional regulator YhcF (GntR family)